MIVNRSNLTPTSHRRFANKRTAGPGLGVLLASLTVPLWLTGAPLDSGKYFVTQSWSQEDHYQRPYIVHIPSPAQNQRLPVLIFLHREEEETRQAMNRFLRAYPSIASQYAIVFPEGYQMSWNILSSRSKAHDLDFIEAIIGKLATFANIKADQFAIMGNSTAGALVNQLAIECKLPNIRTYVIAASPLNSLQHDGKHFKAKGKDNHYKNVAEPARGKRILTISGTVDPIVPYSGRQLNHRRNKQGPLNFLDAEESIYRWARQMGTGGGKLAQARRKDNLEIFSYLDGDVVHFKVEGRGHDALDAVSETHILHFLEASEPVHPPKTDVFISGQDGYHTYRIPSMVVTKNGTILAICEGRRTGSKDHGDVDLVLKRSTDRGSSWSPMSPIWGHHDTHETTIGNPCALLDESTGRIWLAMCRDQFEVLITYSDDDGQTWAKPRNITAAVKNPIWSWPESIHTPFGKSVVWTGPGTGVQLKQGPHAGRLIIPCHMRPRGESVEQNRMWVFYSDDHGELWRHSESSALGNESQVVELSDGRLMLNGRNQNKKGGAPFHRLVSFSTDGGANWSESVVDDELLEPVCQASLIAWGQSDRTSRILFSNPADNEERVRMTVRLSTDAGETWPISRVVHPERCEYSSLAILPDDHVGLLFKGDRRIMFTQFSFAWLTNQDL